MSGESADIVIVGGGIMGMSIAFQVARRSKMSVIVLEKGGGLGEGSTGGSSAITRQRYSKAESVRIARDGNVVWRNWSEYTGLSDPLGRFHDIGVLWMMNDDAGAVAADRNRLVAEGIDAVMVDAAELAKLYPGLSACMVPFDLTGEVEHECADGDAFLIERDTGFFDATDALVDVATAAAGAGVDVRMRSEVVDVKVDGGRARGVVLADGSTIDAGLVVNAAGPWCNRINAMAGLDLSWSLVPTRVQVIYRALPEEVPRPIPVVGDAAGGIYFRPEAGGGQIIVGSILEEDEIEVADPDNYNIVADRSFIDLKIHALHHRIPALPYVGVPGGMASLYTVNRQDVLPIVGPTSMEGFAVVNGFSGHGFKESQMIGSMMAQWITGERADFDTNVPMSFFAVDRDPVDIEAHTVLA
ncbi:MAG: FAD-binding oxidoreductase [Acidimicrobiia bacterium]|nr:MAG: FAD-binding oxidoreductase [Acidimicrobiia bacterium]